MLLPPDNREKFLYHQTNKTAFYLASSLSSSILLIGIVFFSLSHWSLFWYLGYALLMMVYLGLSFGVGVFSDPFDIKEHYSRPDNKWRPSIDIFLPSCGEDLAVIKNTILGAKRMAEYYRWATLYILDDAANPELEQFAKEQNINYLARKTNELRKAGNLRHAFKYTKGEWILILDADFVPREDMLNEMIPLIDDNTAIIQTPQFFRVNKEMAYIARGASFVQELFYRLIQVNRNHFEAPVCVGTCALYRRFALEPFGGTAPIAYSEDLHTGFYVMTHGWKVKYFPINLATGLCPDTIKSYFTQQYRWCMGSFTLMLNPEFWKAKAIDLIQRACFMTGMLYYIATALSVVFTALPALIVLWKFPHLAHWYSILFSLPSLLVGTIVIGLWSKHPFGLYAIDARTIAYWAHLVAIIDKLRGDLMPWVPTGNVGKNSRYVVFKYAFTSYVLIITALLIGGVIKNWGMWEMAPMVALTVFYRFLDIRIMVRLFTQK